MIGRRKILANFMISFKNVFLPPQPPSGVNHGKKRFSLAAPSLRLVRRLLLLHVFLINNSCADPTGFILTL